MFAEKDTPHYRSLIDRSAPDDPLQRMICFSELELVAKPGESDDPIGDERHQCCANGRLVHRYPDRVLLLVTDRCAAHCRYCFRRNRLSSSEADITAAEFAEALQYVIRHDEIREVILTGGDPLSLPDDHLLEIILSLKEIGVSSIRLHTRYPVYEPSRCDTFAQVARHLDIIVVHVNHHREVSPEFCRAATLLRAAPFLLNQSVLLKGVNDSVEELAALSRSLGGAGVLPYYLHYPDLASGTAHWRISLNDAMRLSRSLAGRLPGYLIPRLVLDIPGGKGKVPLSDDLFRQGDDGACSVKSPLTGELIDYREVL